MSTKFSEEEKKLALQATIYRLTEQEPFYGNLLQQLTVKYTEQVPTAGITFNEKTVQYEMYINPKYFIKRLNNELKISVFQHEVLHFTNKHLFRLPFLSKSVSNNEKSLFNLAGDMAINQFLSHTAKGCKLCEKLDIKSPEEWESTHPTEEDKDVCPGKWVDVKDWKLDDGSLFPTFQSMEIYHDLIKKESEKQKGNKKTKGNVNEMLEKFPNSFDEHNWDDLDEETKKKMIEEAQKVIKRTIEKTSHTHTVVPNEVKDMLQELEIMSSSLNYKQILKNAIRRTVSTADRESTWRKPNKRYGIYSPGSKTGEFPSLYFSFDTSGSMSYKEINECLHIMENFLKVGVRTCMLSLWHTNMYYKKPYRLKDRFKEDQLQAGGTDIREALEDIKKSNPNLSLIFTDGYFDAVNIKLPGEVIFIITKGGNTNHPMKHVGKTIELDKLR